MMKAPKQTYHPRSSVEAMCDGRRSSVMGDAALPRHISGSWIRLCQRFFSGAKRLVTLPAYIAIARNRSNPAATQRRWRRVSKNSTSSGNLISRFAFLKRPQPNRSAAGAIIAQRREGSTLFAQVRARRLDAITSDAIKRELREVLRGCDAPCLVLDLSKVEFIDAAGLETLLWMRRRLAEGQSLSLTRPCPTVLSMLKLTRLDRLFNAFPGEDQKVAAVPTLAR